MTVAVRYEMLPVVNAWDLETALTETFGFVFDRAEIRNLLFRDMYHNDSYQRLDLDEYRNPNDWGDEDEEAVKYNLVIWYLKTMLPEDTRAVIINTAW